MSNKLICPFCQKDLRTVLDSPFYTCDACGYTGYKQLWTALIQVKEDLKDCQHNYSVKSEQHERGYAYATKTIKDLESKLEITRQALEKLNCEYNRCRDEEFEGADIDWEWWAMAAKNVVEIALEQIEHKE